MGCRTGAPRGLADAGTAQPRARPRAVPGRDRRPVHLRSLRALLDTSVLIGDTAPDRVEAAISVASIAELHFGVLVARDDDERALRTQRLGAIEAAFDPLALTADVAREWGRLAAAVSIRGGQPRRRTMDLAIAATANVHKVPLMTDNISDFAIIADLVDTRTPG
jgi:predicted nucleic acid-binding protein